MPAGIDRKMPDSMKRPISGPISAKLRWSCSDRGSATEPSVWNWKPNPTRAANKRASIAQPLRASRVSLPPYAPPAAAWSTRPERGPMAVRGGNDMDGEITEAPTGNTMILRAFARFPGRQAFVWDGGSLTYAAARDLIGRLQAAMVAAGVVKGQTVA